MPRNLTISFQVSENAATGEAFIILTDNEVDQQLEIDLIALDDRFEARKAAAGGRLPADQQTAYEMSRHEMKMAMERYKAQCANLRGTARTLEYNLTVPTHEDDLRAREAATTFDAIGLEHFSQNKYAIELTKAVCNDKVPYQMIASEHPTVGREIMARIVRAATPDRRRLPFSASAL